MRTHLISSTEPDEKGHYGKKLPPLINQEFNGEKKRIDHFDDPSNIGYCLRENPKKTNKFVKSSEDDSSLPNMICKECGKSFQSWKALFGHIKCHSEKVSNNLEEDSFDSSNQKEIIDNQSDNEASAMNKKKRSRRVKKKSENLNVFNASSSSPCVSDIDQEPEEAAMSLLLLSRDAGIPRNWQKMNTSEVQINDISENCRAKSIDMDSGNGFEFTKKKDEIKVSCKFQKKSNPRKGNSSKRKSSDLHDPYLAAGYPKEQGNSEAEIDFSKYSFECISCNKTFHSFQALGGHRASHRRIKACFASKIGCSENSTETELSPDQTDESTKVIKCFKEKFETDHESKKKAQSNQSIVIHKSTKEERDFLDLNFPPPDEEESNGLVGFQKWWVQSSHKQEQLVGILGDCPRLTTATAAASLKLFEDKGFEFFSNEE
ncbi:hypothetical protein Leryth_021906 [Lithospermum erythrorhizon]|nr:hypothetical protein Leryth_021906 [Lithospermum erythrorhizon]